MGVSKIMAGSAKAKPRTKKIVKKKKQSRPIFPPAFHAFCAQRLTDIIACSFAGLGVIIFAALYTYNSGDISFNAISGGTEQQDPQNILGTTGAHIADLFLQTLGLSAYLISVVLIFWGARIFLHHPMRPLLPKISFLILSCLTGAIALARIPAFESWTMGSYLGGSIGSLLFNQVTTVTQSVLGTYTHLYIAGVAGLISIICFCAALNLEKQVWQRLALLCSTAVAMLFYYTRLGYYKINSWHAEHSHKPVRPNLKMPKLRTEKETPAEPVATKPRVKAPHPSEMQTPANPAIVTPPKAKAPAKAKSNGDGQLSFDTNGDQDWQLPTLEYLQEADPEAQPAVDKGALQKNAEMLQTTLNDFNVYGDVTKVNPGPIVTLYELEPAPGTKSSRVIGLADDIARSMSAVSARVAVIPGKNALGIELPNQHREMVYLREILESKNFDMTSANLPLVLGKDIGGGPVIADLARMPHLLVAGTTGSGKSVAVNTMILSLLYRMPPEKCRFIMIDPKMLELSVYDDIPHLLTPVVTEPHKAITALKWAVREMEDRYRAMSKLGVRNIEGFNKRAKEALEKGEVITHRVQTGFDMSTGKPVFEEQALDLSELPYIVVIVDEFADLMLVAGKEVENAIQRLAQMARAAGIHLIMATQRPSVDVITGVIKANFPTRISFSVTSKVDSRTILGDGGAEQLLGQGDMLYMAAGGKIKRVHGPFVDDDEVENVVNFLKKQGEPDYVTGVTDGEDGDDFKGIAGGSGNDEYDELYDQAVALVIRERKASTSFVQRHLQIGYNRAARIVETMEKEGIISAANHVGRREILLEAQEEF